MQKGVIRSINHPTRYPSVWLVAAAICLCPAAAGAQLVNPTVSDTNGNTAAGTDALLSVTATGLSNTAIGQDALRNNTTGDLNTASGRDALRNNTTGNGNTATGSNALMANTAASNNTANGRDALMANTSGDSNTASGANALRFNTSGFSNTASGASALFSNTTGDFNTASGVNALNFNTTGDLNTANGVGALALNTTGSFNTASGARALINNASGNENTALGYEALLNNITGRNNTAVGAGALAAINGINNTAVGFDAGSRTTAGNHNIYIGHPGINAGESRVIRIGSNQTRTYLRGIAGVPVNGATVVVRANGQLGVIASSKRYKQDIAPLGDASDKLARLRPVSYRYKTEPEATHYGLIAEEVDKVMPELVVRDEQNRPETVQYQELIPLLLQQWKAQQAEIARQRGLIERQAAALTELRRTLATRFAARDGAH